MAHPPKTLTLLVVLALAIASPARAAPPERPALNINLLIEGQSNAAFFTVYGGLESLRRGVAHNLGFQAPRQTITVLGDALKTMWSGVGLIRPPHPPTAQGWLDETGPLTWRDDTMQRVFVAYLENLPAPIRSSPTVTLWLHNENDSYDLTLTQPEWESALRHAVGEERAALAQGAPTTPVDFVFVPFDCTPPCIQLAGFSPQVQILRAGFAHLAADRGFNAVIGAQIGDSDMTGTGALYGGMHMNRDDAAQLAARLVNTVSNQLAAYAQPGSPEAVAKGALPWIGPEVIRAIAVDPHHVRVTIAGERGAHDIRPLSQAAEAGAGWSIVDGKHLSYAASAQFRDGTIVLTFPDAVPRTGQARLQYGWGTGRIFVARALPWKEHPERQPGRNAAIYDGHGLPLWVAAAGLPLR